MAVCASLAVACALVSDRIKRAFIAARAIDRRLQRGIKWREPRIGLALVLGARLAALEEQQPLAVRAAGVLDRARHVRRSEAMRLAAVAVAGGADVEYDVLADHL
jgi:hypothetical protein